MAPQQTAVSREDVRWMIPAGIGLALCLILNGTFDRVLMGQVDVVSFPLRISDDPLSGGPSVVVMCLLIVLAAHRGLLRPRAGVVGTALLSAVCVASTGCLFLSTAGVVPSVVGEIGGLVLGAAAILLLALWAEVLARAGWVRSLLTLAVALVLDTLVDITASNALVDSAVIGLVLASAVASPCLLFALDRSPALGGSGAPAQDGAGAQTGAPATSPAAPAATATSATTFPLVLSLVCIALWGFTMGRVQSLDSSTSGTGIVGFISNYVTNIGALLVALLAFGLTRLRSPHTTARVFIIVCLVATLYLSGVFGSGIEPAGMVMMTVTRMSILVYIWLLASDAGGSREPDRPALVLAAGWSVFTLVNTVSTKLGLYVLVEGVGFVVYTMLIVACLIGLIVIELLPRRRATSGATAGAAGWADGAREGSEGPAGGPGVGGTAGAGIAGGPGVGPTEVRPDTAADLLAARCEELARRYDLTAREQEVLVPLVRGRSAASIAASLNMSTETARTHIRHIYQKTDIHSRDELMDIVDTPREG